MGSSIFYKGSKILSSSNLSLINGFSYDKRSSTRRTRDQCSLPGTTPLLSSECIKKTVKPELMSKRKYNIKELLDLRPGDQCFINKDMLSGMAGLGLLKAEEGPVLVDSKVSRKRSICDAYELVSERKRKKTSEKTVQSNSQRSVSQPNVWTDSSLRAAMIRIRFADTILKAEDKLLLNQVNESEKKKLERRKAYVKSELRMAETILKEQRQKERESARIALEKMVRTVEWNHALESAHEFHKLFGVEGHVDFKPLRRDDFDL